MSDEETLTVHNFEQTVHFGTLETAPKVSELTQPTSPSASIRFSGELRGPAGEYTDRSPVVIIFSPMDMEGDGFRKIVVFDGNNGRKIDLKEITTSENKAQFSKEPIIDTDKNPDSTPIRPGAYLFVTARDEVMPSFTIQIGLIRVEEPER